MLRETIADIIRKKEQKADISKTENDLLKEYLRGDGSQTQEDEKLCKAIRTHFPGTWKLILGEKRNQQNP